MDSLYDIADTPHKLGKWHPLTPDTVATELLTANTSNVSVTEEKFKLFLESLVTRRLERELIKALSELSGFSEIDILALVQSRLLHDSNPPDAVYKVLLAPTFWQPVDLQQVSTAVLKPLRDWTDRLFRLNTLTTALKLDTEFMQLADLVIINPNNTPHQGINWLKVLADFDSPLTAVQSQDDWQALLDLLWLQQPDKLSRPVLIAVVNAIHLRGNQAVIEATVTAIANRVRLTAKQTLDIMALAVDIADANKLLDPRQLRKAFELVLLARHLGADAAQIKALSNLQDNVLAASTAKAVVKAQFSESAWLKIKPTLEDPLRQLRRDALVALLVNSKGYGDVNTLYEHFLIDPLIEPCMKTTRILEAVSATQLLMQRILFGLEPSYIAAPELKQQWVWMRNYRVWEANRKVYLFPENWLFPELRDDKSSSFKQLESALGQGELNQELAVQAFGEFLDDVAQMGQIEVLGMYEDISYDSKGNILRDNLGNPQRRILYVVGRTQNPPYTYFWRKCIDFGSRFMEWSPWQRVELDIQGDHVMPFVLGSSLHLAWPIIKYNQQVAPKKNEWEVKLAWSRYDGKNWRKSSISRDSAIISDIAFMDERWGFSFRIFGNIGNNEATIGVYTLDPIAHLLIHNYWLPSTPASLS